MNDRETQLVHKAQQGNKKAFGKLVKKYRNKVLYLAYDLVGNYDDAQDIAQNAFLKALNGIRSFQGKSAFSTWLYRIVVNLAIDFKRSKTRKKQISIETSITENSEISIENILEDKHIPPDRIVELKDFNVHAKKAIDKLPNNQRVAFILRHYHDLSMKEIAAVLECEPGTVRSHLFRAINRLRDELKEFESL